MSAHPSPRPPLIVTLKLDAESFGRFDALRRAHFPLARNVLSAHLTLFHALPGEDEAQVAADLTTAARRPAMDLRVEPPFLLGRGVAYRLASPELKQLRGELAALWAERLTPQDRSGFRPHVTVQNKVAPDEARALHAGLTAGFAPWVARGEGLQLWRYLGGPWEAAGEFALAQP